MRQRNTWAAAGVVIVALLAFVAGGIRTNAGAADVPDRASHWPPPPTNIVNVSGEQKGDKVNVPGGGTGVVVYTVPPGRAFIVTDAYLDVGPLAIFEDSGGTVTMKLYQTGQRNSPAVFTSHVGLAFKPGSRVIATTQSPAFNLTGYTAEP